MLGYIRSDNINPTHTNTDLNGRTGTQTVEEGAAIIVRMVLRITSPDPIPDSGPSACGTEVKS